VPAVEAGEEPGQVDLAERQGGTDRQMSAHQPADGGHGGVPISLFLVDDRPGETAHRFTNIGLGPLRVIAIHTAADMDTEWLTPGCSGRD
jgi:hypothetical protein